MNYFLIALFGLFLVGASYVSYESFETVEAKTLKVETPVGPVTTPIPDSTPTAILEKNVPQEMNWTVTPEPTKKNPNPKPTYVHKAKKKTTPVVAKTTSTNTGDINITLPEFPKVTWPW